MANTDPNTKEKFDIYKNDIDQLRQILDAWVDLSLVPKLQLGNAYR